MARRKRGMIGKVLVLAVLVLAVVGAWTIWHTQAAQDGISAAKKAAGKAERAAKAARKAW